VGPAGEHALNMAHQLFSERNIDAEYLIGYEGNAFASTGDVHEDLLSIISVHPMREDAVGELLSRAGADWSLVSSLLGDGKLIEVTYQGNRFYTRKLLPTTNTAP
jgi:wyosine [tRNA(Phe)-imidazoG37] synthetase (radical SAM superfamily)